MRAVRLLAFGLAMTCGCGGPFGNAPLVLTEVPNRPSGEALIARGAARSGCAVERETDGSLMIRCAEGDLHLPTFAGPPTFAVRCVDARLQDPVRCKALVRKILLSADPDAEGSL
jgi:hypothetical protein